MCTNRAAEDQPNAGPLQPRPSLPARNLDGSLPRLGRQPALEHKEPLADDPGMGCGKLHEGAEAVVTLA